MMGGKQSGNCNKKRVKQDAYKLRKGSIIISIPPKDEKVGFPNPIKNELDPKKIGQIRLFLTFRIKIELKKNCDG